MSRLSFAVVREDPAVELAVLDRALPDARAALTVASGGCTALSLVGARPSLDVCAFDTNPAQLAHVRAKFDAALDVKNNRRALNIHDDDPSALNQQGEFERLFRVLRAAIEQLVTSRIGLEVLFIADEDAAPPHAGAAPNWVRSPYWSPVFTSVFHDAMLEAMFGPAATQHAEKGSYPLYFQRAFERGLSRPDARTNYFLHHVLLGRYLDFALPPYLERPAARMPRLVEGSLQDVSDLERYDLLSLSNVLDWSDASETARWADTLQQRAKRGAIVLVRQLNNQRDLSPALGPDFALDAALSNELLAMDKSLFYERVLAFRRVRGGAS